LPHKVTRRSPAVFHFFVNSGVGRKEGGEDAEDEEEAAVMYDSEHEGEDE
jgi:hypothetical protein